MNDKTKLLPVSSEITPEINEEAKLSPALKDKVLIQLRAEGRSMDYIAQKLNMSKTTIVSKITSMRNEIHNRKFELAENLLQEYEATNRDMLRNYLILRNNALQELSTRDLTTMHTKDLINYLNFLNDKIENYKSELVYKTQICEQLSDKFMDDSEVKHPLS